MEAKSRLVWMGTTEHLLLCLHFTGQDAETGGRVQWLSSISQLVPAIIETLTLIVNSLLSILPSGLHFLM